MKLYSVFQDSPRRFAFNNKAPVITDGPRSKMVMSGDNVNFTCLTSGDPKPTVTWHRKVVHRSHGNYQVIDSGVLLLNKVELFDEGEYFCSAKNINGVQRSKAAILTVDVAPSIQVTRTVYNVTWGSEVELSCSAYGAPPPRMYWLKDEKQLPQSRKELFHSVLSFTATQSVKYTCQAVTHLRSSNSILKDSKDFYVYVFPTLSEETDEVRMEEERMFDDERLPEAKHNVTVPSVSNGTCLPYSGVICAAELRGAGLVFYNYSNSPVHVNEKITEALWIELITPLPEPCRSAARRLLCYYAFPQCEGESSSIQAKPLCR
ncbi:muscle, skeletal receptor tyrosine protein kinase-like isoform X2 [Limulus polyphemus]|uniref:Muscle, skeletal receptor tyrosine protein kinase-like isoform X2 n=1 Tax=Limulus polyphemus TaxID=6850 RepID=A0ABM1RVT9_LIMPO|nr:muscle, skeletal receptor tyrosine protein kinase-like isoform X2 [Limulus polyphemus]